MGEITPRLNALILLAFLFLSVGMFSSTEGETYVAISISSNTQDVTCIGGSDGAIDIAVSGGSNGYNFSWSGPDGFSSSSEDISGLSAGTYNLTVTDNSSPTPQESSTSVTISEDDDVNPTISAPADITVNTDPDKCTASNVTLGTPDANDNCAIKGITNNAPSVFPIGNTVITWTVIDDYNNTETATQNVTVEDNQYPTISAPADITVNTDTDKCTASNITLGTPDANDNCGIQSITNDAPSVFPIGNTVITWTVTDDSNNTQTATQNVIVEDNQNPGISPPADITVNTDTDKCTASNVTLGTPDANDNCGIQSITNDAPSVFPIGNTVITWTVTDDSNNTQTATQNVTVEDNQKPVIIHNGNQIIENDTGECSAFVEVSADAADNCGVPAPTGTRNDGMSLTDPYPVGTTIITWQVLDNNENSATAVEQHVTVQDKEAPALPEIQDIISGCEYTVTAPVTSDNCSGEITGTTSDPLSYSTEGTHTITWKFQDDAGNTSSLNQEITISPLGAEIEFENISCHGANDGSIEVMFAYGGHNSFEYSIDGANWQTDNSFSALVPGIYNIQLRDSKKPDCVLVLDADLEITQPEVLTSSIYSKTDVLCKGLATGEITALATGGTAPYTFSWGSLGFGERKQNLPAGEYTLIVIDANGCETAPITVEITEPESFIEITEVTSTSGCFGENNGTATVSATGGTGNYSYLWDNGQITQTATGLAPGEHTVIVTDENDCQKERTITVSAPAKLEISGFLTTETTSYGSATGSATVQVTGGTPTYNFEWSNGHVGQTASNLLAGTYSVTVTDKNGCTTTKDVVVVDSLDAEILPTSICDNKEDIIRTSSFSIVDGGARGGTAPYKYEWTFKGDASISNYTGIETPKIKYGSIGDKEISVKITDVNGLTLTKTIIQYVGGCFSTDCGSNDLTADDYYIGDSSGTPITAENCGSAEDRFIYIYIPSNPSRYSLSVEFIFSIENIESGNIQNFKELGCFYEKDVIPDRAKTFKIDYSCGDIVKIEGIRFTFSNKKNDECGEGNKPKCYSTNNETTVFSPLYAVAFANELLCNGSEDGKITIRASGGVLPYRYYLNGELQPDNIIEGLAGGTYNIEVRDAENKSHFLTTEIKQPTTPLQLKLIEQTDITCFGGTDGTATVAAQGGTPATSGEPYIYVWDNGQTGPTATNLEAGDYNVNVIDTNGCTTWLTVTIIQPDKLVADAGPDQVLNCGITTTFLAASLLAEDSEEFTGEWTIINGPAGGGFTDATNPLTNFTGAQGTYTLRWSIDCGMSDDVKITFSNCNTIDFDGTNDYIVFGDNFNRSTYFSLEAWTKLSTEASSGVKTVLSKRNMSNYSSSGYDLVVDNRTPKFRWNGNVISSSDPISTDRWYHLAVITNNDSTYLFVDGIQVAQGDAAAPTANNFPFIIGAIYNSETPAVPSNYFHGWIEEVRIWNTALTTNQLHFMMNQKLQKNGDNVKGQIIPLDVPENLAWENLEGYYQLEKIANGYTTSENSSGINGRMVNITTSQQRTAPLPYISARTGYWFTDNTWTRPQVWDPPNSRGITGEFINWNIAQISHKINSNFQNIHLLGLISKEGAPQRENSTLKMEGSVNNASGNGLTISHYLELNGVIDLNGESQLIQSEGSILAETSSGYIDREQQGTASSYNYNYWSSPVVPQGEANNSGYTVFGVMKDGSPESFGQNLNFGNSHTHADKEFTTPRKVSNYWINAFRARTADAYSSWEQIGSNAQLKVGEGYTMKGTSGEANLTTLQNYVFRGKPNNGTITLNIGPNQNYLIGNPYPSALSVNEFFLDNLKDINGGRNDQNAFNGALYFWDHFSGKTHVLSEYVGGYAVLNLVGAVAAIATDERINATGDSSDREPGDFIPVGQGFFINTEINQSSGAELEGNGGVVKFKNNQRRFRKEGSNSQFLKPETRQKTAKTEEDRSKIRLNFQSPLGYHRQILLGVDQNASNDFDLGYDALLNDYNLEDMFWLIDGWEYVIQGVGHINPEQVLPIGLRIEKAGELKILIAELENISENVEIYIRDKSTETYHDLRNSEYNLEIEPGDYYERFEIVFQKPAIPEEEEEDNPKENPGDGESPEEGEGETPGEDENPEEGSENPDTENPKENPEDENGQNSAGISLEYLMDRKQLVIYNPGAQKIDEVRIFTLNGQQLETFTESTTEKEIYLHLMRPVSTSVYIVKVHTAEKVYNKKIIVDK
ncbi:LamG-like jellyroll fold domain-containing protein [Autumnicola psychrophila]|uniref:LamG-like jellyroll fold domain-containing protein n=1 Tax=Autumnicola psychrophila TaxID=3075592 RepID=A0ABU3DMM4_9FLAO|nr:LamG-like jellyroll fold domain-containing protein [Zunongwangia sp. F225]MDT0684936.1 LamG-like jellyroll fold domain-containing protein [Zunongwangia sp. F225]